MALLTLRFILSGQVRSQSLATSRMLQWIFLNPVLLFSTLVDSLDVGWGILMGITEIIHVHGFSFAIALFAIFKENAPYRLFC